MVVLFSQVQLQFQALSEKTGCITISQQDHFAKYFDEDYSEIAKVDSINLVYLLHMMYLDTAYSYLYVRENYVDGKPNNRSPEIDRFNLIAGAPVGSYWCMSFVYYCVNAAAKQLEIKNPLLRTASVSKQLRYANLIGSKLRVLKNMIGLELQNGDIFCIKTGTWTDRDIGKIWSGHTGFIFNKARNDIHYTIEGNTNKAGSRNGDRVAIRKRLITEYIAIIRIESI